LESQEIAKIEAQKELDRKLLIESEDIKWIMSNKRGRRYIWRLITRAGVYKTSFTANSNATAFNEGARNIGLSIISDVYDSAPESFEVMVKENRQ